MAKQTMKDVLAALTNSNSAIETATKAKDVVRKKTEIEAIMADVFLIDAELRDLDKASKDFEGNVKDLKIKQAQTARQRLATAFSNTPKALMDDRTDEGIKALRESLETTRRSLYDAEYSEKLPETVTIAGKEQSIKFKDGKVKYASWDDTKRTWNIGSQLLGDVDKYGWAEVMKGTKVVPYADTQKWSIDENGEIVKVKPSEKGKVTPSKDGYALIEAAIESLRQRLNRKDVDLVDVKGSKLLDDAMLVISTAKGKALTAAAAAK